MYEVKWTKGEVDGRVGLICPYNENFQQELKTITTSAKFRRSDNAWCFDEETRPLVMPIVEQYFTDTTWQRVTITLNRDDNVTVDGARLMYVNRDYWNWRRDTPVRFRIIEAEVSPGGSRAHPTISGTLVLEIDLREGVEIDPEPDSIEPLSEQEAANPLANYAIEELAAELARRERTTAAMLKDDELVAELRGRDIGLYDYERIIAAMRAAFEQMYPNPGDATPDDESDKNAVRQVGRFIRLMRQELEEW